MELMARRRELMTDSGLYVRDGLVLWMDGIDKGSVSGAWVDKVSGHVFENINGMTVGSNYIGLNSSSSQYLRNSTFDTQVKPDAGTIEVVIDGYSFGNMVFMPKNTNCICFGFRSSPYRQYITGGGAPYGVIVTYQTGVKMFSANNDLSVHDWEKVLPDDAGQWAGPDSSYNYIGRRNSGSGNYFNGKIYAIRIYSRKLTQDEMIHNQRIDNRRFNLGLTI